MVTVTATHEGTQAAGVDMQLFRVALERLRTECVRQRDLAVAESSTSLPDAVAVSRAAGLGRTIGDVDVALARIEAGSYGTCIDCGESIPLSRLEVRPFASTCVACAGRRR